MNDKMIEVLESLGFTKNEEGQYTITIEYEVDDDETYVASVVPDYYWGHDTLQIFEVYEDCVSGEGVELAAFILREYE